MKILCQLSGGYDSVAACIKLLNEGHEVAGMFFNINQPYLKKEEDAVDYVHDYLKEKYDNWLGAGMRNAHMVLSDPSSDTPTEYIPVRNFVLATHSANIAIARGFDAVAVGSKTIEVREGDPYSFADCSVEFYKRVQDLTNFCTEGETSLQFLMPLVRVVGIDRSTMHRGEKYSPLSKGEVVQIILDSGMDISKLWTCYGHAYKPCGICYHCKEAKKAFDDIRFDYKDFFIK